MGTENQLRSANVEPNTSMAKFRGLLSTDAIKNKFNEALGKKAPMFISNLTTIMSGSAELQKCDHMSVISSALMAASMDLPLTPGLGFAGIVPYFDGPSQTMKAQFQVMKKGFIQLAQRTGLFKIINVSEVYEGELKSHNKFTGEYIFDESSKKSDNIVGYVSYFRLINGFEKYYYMPMEKLDTHAKRYSKSFQKGKGKWADKEEGGYEQMCEKTVLKLNLSTYAPLSVDINMMNAIVYDQAEIRDVEAKDYDYVDNEDSHKPEEKDVMETSNGGQIVINKTDVSKSEERTARAVNKINPDKFSGKNISDATIINEIGKAPVQQTIMQPTVINESHPADETPFIPSKGSSETFNGIIVVRDEHGEIINKAELETGNMKYPPEAKDELTLAGMEKMETKDLLEIINADTDMIEAMTVLPGKNTNKKIREIIFAHQNGRLTEYVAELLPKPEVPPIESNASNPPENASVGEIPINKDFDKQAKELFPGELEKPKATEGVNKYGIPIPDFDKGESRDFATMRSLFNGLVSVNPPVNNPRYLELAGKMGILAAFPDRETFCKNATVKMINELLDTN